MNVVLWTSQILLAGAMLLALVRLMLGPTMANRVVALDLMTSIVVGMMALLAVQFEEYALIDYALAVGIIAFLSTAAFALLLDRDPAAGEIDRRCRRGRREPDGEMVGGQDGEEAGR